MRYVLLAALALALLSTVDARAESPDPCHGVSCSYHGRCIEKDGVAACACDPGYFPDQKTGLGCMPLEWLEIEEEQRTDPPIAIETGIVARAGIVLSSIALVAYLGKVHAASLWMGWKKPPRREKRMLSSRAWWSLGALEIGLHGGGVPLALASHMKVRKALGLSPSTRANTAGWCVFALTVLTQLFEFTALSEPLENIGWVSVYVQGLFIITSMSIAVHEGHQALEDARKVTSIEDAPAFSFTPFFLQVQGGGIVGIRGSF